MLTFLSGLPQYIGGRRTAQGKLDDRWAPLPLEQFVDRFAEWVAFYNERAHSELDGQTPRRCFSPIQRRFDVAS